MKAAERARFAQSLSRRLSRPWAERVECGHASYRRGCVFCALERGQGAINARMLDRMQVEERARLVEQAEQRSRVRTARKGESTEPVFARLQDKLVTAGVVEVEAACFRPGITRVTAAGLLGRVLQDDEVRTILQRAEEVLRQTRNWRVGVRWDANPPFLLATSIPKQVSLL